MTTVYLSPTGSDSYTYTQAQNPATPWATPGKVQTSATSGDTVSMAAGTYTFSSVTFTKSFTFIGATLSNGFPTTILDGASVSATWSFSGQTISLTNLMFQNVVISTSTRLFFGNGTGTLNATSCVFRTIQLNDANAFVLREPLAGTFTNCLFYGITSSGHTSTGLFAFPTALTLNNCTIYLSDSTNYVKNIVHTTISGTITITNLVAFSITSSTSWRNAAGTATWQLTYSCLYNFGGSPSGTGVITSDPLFVDAANSNFNLRPTSPCIDTGILV